MRSRARLMCVATVGDDGLAASAHRHQHVQAPNPRCELDVALYHEWLPVSKITEAISARLLPPWVPSYGTA